MYLPDSPHGQSLPGEGWKTSSHVLTIQLVTIQMLCSRIAFSAAFVRAFEFPVKTFAAPAPLSRGASNIRTFSTVGHITVAIVRVSCSASTANGIVLALWRSWGRRFGMLLVDGGGHDGVVGLSKVGGVTGGHRQNLRRHRIEVEEGARWGCCSFTRCSLSEEAGKQGELGEEQSPRIRSKRQTTPSNPEVYSTTKTTEAVGDGMRQALQKAGGHGVCEVERAEMGFERDEW